MIIGVLFIGLIYVIVYLIKDAINTKKINTEIQQKELAKIRAEKIATKRAEEEEYRRKHQYLVPTPIDLGLKVPILWSNINVGSSIACPYGEWFNWGSIKSCSKYTHDNLKTNSMTNNELKDLFSNYKGDFSSLKEYDAATSIFNSTWRTPTADEVRSLIEECNWESITKGSEHYWKVTGPNGNYILLPTFPQTFRGKRITGFFPDSAEYWTSSPSEDLNSGSNKNLICRSKMLRIIEIWHNAYSNEGATIDVKIEDKLRDDAAFIRPVMNK